MKTIILFFKKIAVGVLFNFFVLIGSMQAQIIYTDIIDATPNATYPLDLNNDTIIDFEIRFLMIDKIIVVAQNNNAYAGNFINGEYLPWALNASDSICNTLATWYGSNNPGTMAWGTSSGYWVGQSDKYLGLKLVVGANTFYGWARIDVDAMSTSFTIKDYAYESNPNTCIESGQSGLGIQIHPSKNLISIFPNPIHSSSTLKIIGPIKNSSLILCNSVGQIVREINNLDEQIVSVPINNLPNGLYFIHFYEKNNIHEVMKIMINN